MRAIAWMSVAAFSVVVGCTGPAGPQGPAGEAGPRGADGEDGEDGTNGTNGSNGAPGTPGTNGTNGLNGENGLNGVNGTDGEDGLPGPVVSDEASHGLAISPVAVDLTGLDTLGVERVGRGSYIVNAIADCAGCHTGNPAQFLGGGVPFGPFPFPGFGDVTVFTRNLTPDGVTGLPSSGVDTEEEFIELIRTGKDFKDATGQSSLMVMPWPTYRWMSDEDLKSIFAYLRAIPAVSNSTVADTKPALPPVPFDGTYNEGEVDRALPTPFFDDGNAQRGLAIQPLAAPGNFDNLSPADQAAFGRGSYLVNAVSNCNDCHGGRDPATLDIIIGAHMVGGAVFNTPPPLQPFLGLRAQAQNLTGAQNGFFTNNPFFDMVTVFTQGIHPDDGSPIGFPMPVSFFQNLTLDDQVAIYTYLSNVEPNATADDVVRQKVVFGCGNGFPDCPGGSTCDVASGECLRNVCVSDSDCGACQTCDVGNTDACLASDPNSLCRLTAF